MINQNLMWMDATGLFDKARSEAQREGFFSNKIMGEQCNHSTTILRCARSEKSKFIPVGLKHLERILQFYIVINCLALFVFLAEILLLEE